MTCKDCIHYEICSLLKDFNTYNIMPEGWNGNTCKYFLHATTVPFVIGQPMWKLCTWYHSPAEILESRVLFPTLGKPTKPTSAITFISKIT